MKAQAKVSTSNHMKPCEPFYKCNRSVYGNKDRCTLLVDKGGLVYNGEWNVVFNEDRTEVINCKEHPWTHNDFVCDFLMNIPNDWTGDYNTIMYRAEEQLRKVKN